MTLPTTLKFGKFLVLLGDGASPENFVAPCGLTTKGFNRSASTKDTNVPDCDDPDAPTWTERDVVALSGTITGSGVVDAGEDFNAWDDWFTSALPKNVKIKQNKVGAKEWLGSYILTKLENTVQLGEKVQFSVELQSTGAIVPSTVS